MLGLLPINPMVSVWSIPPAITWQRRNLFKE